MAAAKDVSSGCGPPFGMVRGPLGRKDGGSEEASMDVRGLWLWKDGVEPLERTEALGSAEPDPIRKRANRSLRASAPEPAEGVMAAGLSLPARSWLLADWVG